jgi:hypothetical protein
MTNPNRPTFSQMNVTISLTHKDGTLPSFRDNGLAENVKWALACLNCNTDRVEATITHATALVGWPDFLDAPLYGPEHPDYAADVARLHKVEHWLTLDREKLIDALLEQHRRLEMAQASIKKAEALDGVLAELEEAGFGTNEPLNGGDCVDMIGEIYGRVRKQFPR